MLSLKYKNIVKTALLETLTEEEVSNNRKTLESFLEGIKYFPHFSIGNTAWIDEEKDSLNIYILTSIGDVHRYAGKKLYDGDIDIYDDDFNQNKEYLYQYYNFTFFTLENHMGILTYDRNKIRYRLLFNYGQEKDLFDIYKFYRNFNKKLKKDEINQFVRQYVIDIANELNRIPVKPTYLDYVDAMNQKKETKSKKEPEKLNAKKIIQSVDDPNLKIYDENELDKETDKDKGSVFNKHENANFMYTDNGKLRLTATRLIGDAKFRTIPNLISKVNAGLTDFNNYTQNKNELLASKILLNEMKNVGKGNGSNPIKLKDCNINTKDTDLHSALLLLSVDPNEIISPIAVLKMDNITWSKDANGNSAEQEIQKIFGDKTAFNNGIISFPQTTNEPLVDSYAMITYNGQTKELGVSTKGGLNGKGANASLSSLFRFLLKEDNTYKMNKWGYNKAFATKIINTCKSNGNVQNDIETSIVPHLSNIGLSYWNTDETKDLLTMLILFGGIPMSYHSTIIKYAVNHGIGKLYFNNTDTSLFASEASTQGLTDLVMDLLDKQKYKFCQVNTKPSLTNEQFKYEIEVQYPAKFSGSVSFKKAPSENGLRFHISGS